MKVCILTTSFPAYEGHFQSPFILELAKGLVNNDLDLDVVCPFYKDSKAKDESIGRVKVHRFQYLYPVSMQRLQRGGGLAHNFKKSFFSKLELIPFLFFYLLKSLKYAKKADIIHAQWILSGFVGVFLKKIYKKPLVLSTRGVALGMASKSRLMRPILKFVVRNCDMLTPNNEHHVAQLQELGVPKSKIQPVANGVAIDLYKPRSKLGLRKKLGIGGGKKVVLYVGWFIERKGVDYLVDAFSKVLDSHKGVVLYLIGKGSLRKSMEDMVDRLNIGNSVRILDPVAPEDVALWMGAADIFVLPSLSEGRPNVIYESMLSGLPVVATDIGGNNEIIEDGKTGFLIKPKDSNAITKKINMLLENVGVCSKVGEEARRYILSLGMSWSDCAKRFKSVYELAIRGRGK